MQNSIASEIHPQSTTLPLRVMIVAGEASSDVHAAHLLRALKQRFPALEAFGMGSTHLRNTGMEIVVDSATHGSVMGFTEVFGALRGLIGAFRTLLATAKARRPDLLIVLDFPDFNMLFANRAKPYCKKCVYFISPQVWAWRRGRVHRLRRDFNKIFPIFPFEEDFYKAHNVEAKWLGHPFFDHIEPPVERERFLSSLGLDPGRPVIAFLPGSRKAEVERLAVVMRDTWLRLTAARPGLQALVPIAPSLDPEWVRGQFSHPAIVLVSAPAQQVLQCATAAVVASGTATLEAAIVGVPFVIVYKLSPLTFFLGKTLVKGTRFIGMPNIISGRQIVPELLQDQVTPEAVAAEVERFLSDTAYADSTRESLAHVGKRLRFGSDFQTPTSTAERVAEELARMVEVQQVRVGDGN